MMGKIKRMFARVSKNPALIRKYGSNLASRVKLVIAYLLVIACKKRLLRQNIWLVREKGTEARDNGYHFFRFLREKHPEIPAYYVITRDAADRKKVEPYGNIVELNSMRHYMLYLAAQVSINSQPGGAAPDPAMTIHSIAKKLRRKDQISVFLQHGITQNELPHWLDYSRTKFDLFCCVAERERNFIKDMYGYPTDVAMTVGFSRFDALLAKHVTKKQILIMPTHRMWLHAANSYEEATKREIDDFMESEYYKTYAALLADLRLVNAARENGYQIVFYPHYAQQSFISSFKQFATDVVVIADRQRYDVQQLLLESAMLVTDYSSVFFDFAYMGKPTLYYQFDEVKYREGHFKKGYFDYHRDGFGPVYKDMQAVVNEVIRNIDNSCQIAPQYQDRVDGFFAFRDKDNCDRIFDEIARKVKVNSAK